MSLIHLSKTDKVVKGEITLNASKSISNRLLIIRALCEENFDIQNLSSALDTVTLQKLLLNLEQNKTTFDAGAAGTTYRFLTAYLAFQNGTQVLTGSERMKNRPIGILVDALRAIGANIKYLEKENYPPLEISEPTLAKINELRIPANISSQYISALLLLAPTMPNGLKIILEGEIVSLPYLKMTLNLMEEFGIDHDFSNNKIEIAPQKYKGKSFTVEADWSAASYYYALAALSETCEIKLNGLHQKSIQGDACIKDIMQSFGVSSRFESDQLILEKDNKTSFDFFHYDFTACPDLAQTVSVTVAGIGSSATLMGLSTLRIKETDRIEALRIELEKVNVKLVCNTDSILQDGKVDIKNNTPPQFDTYEDHRMAMAFASLALLGNVKISEPSVVVKSYPDFWKDLEELGFKIEKLS